MKKRSIHLDLVAPNPELSRRLPPIVDGRTIHGRPSVNCYTEVIMFSKFITIRVKGYAGPGWEIECTGPRKWVEETIKKYIPKVKRIALNISV